MLPQRYATQMATFNSADLFLPLRFTMPSIAPIPHLKVGGYAYTVLSWKERKDQVAICFTLHYNIKINTKSSVRYGKPMRCHRVVLMFTRVRSVSEGEMPCEIR